MVTVTNTNPPVPPSGWGQDSWTFAVDTAGLLPRAGIGAAVAQEGNFNYFVTVAVVQISYNVNPFGGDNDIGSRIAVPPRARWG